MSQPRSVDSAKIKIQSQVNELRSNGWSYPAMAKHLNISVGTAWNMANTKVAEFRNELDRLA